MEAKPQKIGISIVVFFYFVMAMVGFFVGWVFEIDVWIFASSPLKIWHKIGIGAGVGLLIVAITQWMNLKFLWSRTLSENLGKILGERTLVEIFFFAAASGFGEEIFFRGAMQHLLSVSWWSGVEGNIFGLLIASIIFGLLHTGPDKKVFLPWTIFASIVGVIMGGIYWYTGDLIAPIIAHFTINYFNLQYICYRENIA